MGTDEKSVIRIGGLELRFLTDEDDSDGRVVMFEFTVPPGSRVPAPHFHVAVDETIYGLDGTTDTTMNGVAHRIGPGDSLFIPRGAVHSHENHGTATARSLIVLTPGSIGRRYFAEMAVELVGGGKPDPARIAAIMARHGLQTAGP
ncbi:cupin domain-containing protein [Zavarzinia aquatilis]|uniref:Cupin domain-containing protein n=1 Tax=Zavarzinia aquatilis TaxID=2211142 RepID=A0A317ED55_9PROT|nr:cupin domain-containing protein [Zavarzinia aquatilis]PWR24661.1 cupin domain-containing protein [Zavarzinia aquatilis]